jgi:glycosyltransferase involved in cell wall biosynthesis
MPVSVSIVIPILNEGDQIPKLVDSLRKLGDGIEVLFVDGGSTDEGPSLVRLSGYPLITSAAGRARQMNIGARATNGDILIFLHADVRVPPESLLALRIAMRDRRMGTVSCILPWPTSTTDVRMNAVMVRLATAACFPTTNERVLLFRIRNRHRSRVFQEQGRHEA